MIGVICADMVDFHRLGHIYVYIMNHNSGFIIGIA